MDQSLTDVFTERGFGPEWECPTDHAALRMLSPMWKVMERVRGGVADLLSEEAIQELFAGIDVEFTFFESDQKSACIAQSSVDCSRYAIGVTGGLVYALWQLIRREEFMAVIRFQTIQNVISKTMLQELALEHALLLVIYHELGHILNGHFQHKGKLDGDPNVYYKAAGLINRSDVSPNLNVSQMLELHADRFAADLAATSMINRIDGMTASPPGRVALSTALFPVMLGSFWVFTHVLHKFSRVQGAEHPAPAMRVATMLTYMIGRYQDVGLPNDFMELQTMSILGDCVEQLATGEMEGEQARREDYEAEMILTLVRVGKEVAPLINVIHSQLGLFFGRSR